MVDLVEVQKQREADALDAGYKAYFEKQQRTEELEGASQRKTTKKVVQGAAALVAEAIREYQEQGSNNGKGRTPEAFTILRSLDATLLASLTLNTVFDNVAREKTIQDAAVRLGHMVELEVMADDLRQQDKKLAKIVQRRVGAQGGSRNRIKAANGYFRANGIERPYDTADAPKAEDKHAHREWLSDKRAKVGAPLLNCLLLALPDMFRQVTVGSGKNLEVKIIMTEEAAALLKEMDETAAWMRPIHTPMVVKPRPWTDYYTGCYYNEKAARSVRLVRTFNKDHRKAIIRACKPREDGTVPMQNVLDAINAIQETPWAINSKVLEVMEWAWENNVKVGKFPTSEFLPVPERLPDDVWKAMDAKERKVRRINLGAISTTNRAITSDIMMMTRDLSTAKDLLQYERFYLPHNMDFRGRVYPVPHFNHQRSDHIKALFQFADGMPLGDAGGFWLKVHIANTADEDKISKAGFPARINWVDQNDRKLCKIAEDPQGTVEIWGNMDSPFCFLAACFEYAAWKATGFSEDFVSYLPIALDGSNSGLQHYSAALRAEDEAALVSLVPSERPADLYQRIADIVRDQVKGDAAEGDLMAKITLKNGVSRNLVKRNVMTFAYSSEQYGFKQQHMEDTMRPLDVKLLKGEITEHPWAMDREEGEGKDGGFKAAGYLAANVWKAVTTEVRKATEGMQWFKTVAGVLAHSAKPLIWTTPVGLPVYHQYNEWEHSRSRFFLYDQNVVAKDAKSEDKVDREGRVLRAVRLNLRVSPTTRINRDKAKSASSPNVIHSMDGAHLQLTVLGALDMDIRHFALIHDSFATHAGNTDVFFHVIRDAFVQMYDAFCPFTVIRDYAESVLDPEEFAKIPPIPEKGTLDLDVIRDALYAFA